MLVYYLGTGIQERDCREMSSFVTLLFRASAPVYRDPWIHKDSAERLSLHGSVASPVRRHHLLVFVLAERVEDEPGCLCVGCW